MRSRPSYSQGQATDYPRTAVTEMTPQTTPIDNDTAATVAHNERLNPVSQRAPELIRQPFRTRR